MEGIRERAEKSLEQLKQLYEAEKQGIQVKLMMEKEKRRNEEE